MMHNSWDITPRLQLPLICITYCVTLYYIKEYIMAKNLSIRKLPPELEKAIQEEVKRRKTTKTEVVLSALKEVFHLKKPTQVQRNIRHFFGKMTAKDYQAFQKYTSDFSAVDAEMWK